MKTLLPFIIALSLTTDIFSQWWTHGGNLVWPYGRVDLKKSIIADDIDAAKSTWDNQGDRLVLLVQKTKQNWQAGFRSQFDVYDDGFVGNTGILASYSISRLWITQGIQDRHVTGLTGVAWNSISGNANFGSNGALIGVSGFVYTNASKGTVPLSIAFDAGFSSESGAADTITLGIGFRSNINQWSPGSTKINQYRAFHSVNGKPSLITGRYYHFYGEGDYPAYFGGSVIQKIYTTNISNPPTATELNTAFPNAQDGETFYIDDNNAGLNFYQVIKKGSDWWVLTATKAN